jgi:hypothetical protein
LSARWFPCRHATFRPRPKRLQPQQTRARDIVSVLSFFLLIHFAVSLVIQASNDLENWASISTNRSDSGTIYIVDPEAGGHPVRFYRAVVP